MIMGSITVGPDQSSSRAEPWWWRTATRSTWRCLVREGAGRWSTRDGQVYQVSIFWRWNHLPTRMSSGILACRSHHLIISGMNRVGTASDTPHMSVKDLTQLAPSLSALSAIVAQRAGTLRPRPKYVETRA